MMARKQLQWIAGPIKYWSEHSPSGYDSMRWEFVGATGAGTMCRRRLRYDAKTRSFTATAISLNPADSRHAKDVLKFYQNAAVQLSDLPKGDLVTKLKAMLPPGEIATATAMSINAGVGWK